MNAALRFSGCMPANLLPFTADLEIDEGAYRKHFSWLAGLEGVTGIVANGHAAEVSSLDREERRRPLAIAIDEIAGRVPVVAGVYADGTAEAVALARDARSAGAAGLLVFPPTLFMWGAQLKPEMALRHFSTHRRCRRPPAHRVPVPAESRGSATRRRRSLSSARSPRWRG